MKHTLTIAITTTALSLMIAGCSSAPTSSVSENKPVAQTEVAPAAPTAPLAPAPVAPAPQVEAPPPPSAEPEVAVVPPAPIEVAPEALALVERLTVQANDSQRHELTEITGFPEALRSLEVGARAPRMESVDLANQPPPEGLTADGSSTQLIVRDWTGLVLVPISTSLSKAYTSEVRLLKIEAHPLNDGRVRVWTRIHNIGNRTLPGQIACRFNMRNQPTATSPYFYKLQVPPHGFRDVFFISPDGDLVTYTVLVRSEEMKQNSQ
ncbi:MAG: hypothetical protein IPP19_01470 [Verrucomicrobia bacterium]|nr:hypothetical protein [Verrucomicrobiota bacterium]